MYYERIAFTGPRFISFEQQTKTWNTISDLKAEEWYVGDAPGTDAFVCEAAEKLGKQLHCFQVGGTEPWRFAARSKQMIDECIAAGGRALYAFPNKDCPDVCYPGSKSWGGSGTWGTVAYARQKGMVICLCPIAEIEIPWWYIRTPEARPRPGQQMRLF